MEDSGVTSFSSSGSVDISLDALDLSSGNPSNMSAGNCNNDQLEQTAGAQQDVVNASTVVETTNQPEAFSPEQGEGDFQR